jgi:hypothetical protein
LIKKILDKLFNKYNNKFEAMMLTNGKILSNQIKEMNKISSLSQVEFSIFSQFGDDGIIQWLIQNIEIENKVFIEFGIEDYSESNTRFLMMNNNWSGLVMDGSQDNIIKLQNQSYYWKFNLDSKAVFIDINNINSEITSANIHGNIGLLHIDLDGNDYYIWKAINVISPIIVIIEYNSIFGLEREISVPYRPDFNRTKAHSSNLFFGSSIKSIFELSKEKGYSFIGCNSAGNNAYFIRNDKVNAQVRPITLKDGFIVSKYRESRNSDGSLSLLDRQACIDLLKGLQVYNTKNDLLEKL